MVFFVSPQPPQRKHLKVWPGQPRGAGCNTASHNSHKHRIQHASKYIAVGNPPPHTQQKAKLHLEQMTLLHPVYRSIGSLHFGQGCGFAEQR